MSSTDASERDATPLLSFSIDSDGYEPSKTPPTDQVVLTLSGTQCPEALPSVMGLLSVDPDAILSDFGQFVVRDRFLATALLRSPDPQFTVKEILYKAQDSRHRDPTFQVDYSYPSNASHSSVSSLSSLPPSNEEIVLTVFAPSAIPLSFLSSVSSVLQEHHARIFNIERLTGPTDVYMCLQFRIAISLANTSVGDLQRQLYHIGCSQSHCDIAVQRAKAVQNAKRIVVFDLSWTLIQCDAVDVVLDAAGIEPLQQDREDFQAGKLSKEQWLRTRVSTLQDLDAHRVYSDAFKKLTYSTGAEQLCKGLRRLGCRLAIISSGCKFIADAAKDALGLDFAFGNEFEIDSEGKFTGFVQEPIIDAERKAELLQMLAMEERVGTEQVVAVGDGPVSAQMLGSAGMSIAFDQPGATRSLRSGHISSRSLASVLYLLGAGP